MALAPMDEVQALCRALAPGAGGGDMRLSPGERERFITEGEATGETYEVRPSTCNGFISTRDGRLSPKQSMSSIIDNEIFTFNSAPNKNHACVLCRFVLRFAGRL